MPSFKIVKNFSWHPLFILQMPKQKKEGDADERTQRY